jgi:hypothetical protein
MIDKPVPGVVTDARTHPAGAKGAKLSLKEVAERAWKARMSPRLRAWVTQQLDKCGVSTGGRRQKAACILDAFRAKVPYVNDPVMGEFMATPDQLLCLDEGGLCIIGGDCFPGGTQMLALPRMFLRQELGVEKTPPFDRGERVSGEWLRTGDWIWGLGGWTRVERQWSTGKKPIDELVLANGSRVPLSPEHHVWTIGEGPAKTMARIRVADAGPGLWLPQPHFRSTQIVSIDRGVREAECFDVTTQDGYVYLPEHDVTVSNCDEASITLAAACLCVGIPAMIVGSSHRDPFDVPTHVFMAFQDDLGDWVRMDGTTKLPVGRITPHAREWWIEPGTEAKESGEGDFVGMSGADQSALDRIGLAYPGIR